MHVSFGLVEFRLTILCISPHVYQYWIPFINKKPNAAISGKAHQLSLHGTPYVARLDFEYIAKGGMKKLSSVLHMHWPPQL